MKKIEPCVGIFFLVGDKLHIDATPLSRAGRYSDHLIHEAGHDAYAETLGIGDRYEDIPRGRVAFNSKTGKFTLLADRCVLRRPEILREIKRRLHLSDDDDVLVGGDSHYVCPRCECR